MPDDRFLMAWLVIFGFVVVGITQCVHAAQVDPRFCGAPKRDAQGDIVRSAAVLRDFERLYPRPKDGRRWYKDHVLPMACGGCDSIGNLQWLHEAAWKNKMLWERRVYGGRSISEGCP